MLAYYLMCNSEPMINYIISSIAIYKLLCFHLLAFNNNELDKHIKVFISVITYLVLNIPTSGKNFFFVSLSHNQMKINLGNSHFYKQMRLSVVLFGHLVFLTSNRENPSPLNSPIYHTFSLLPKSEVTLEQPSCLASQSRHQWVVLCIHLPVHLEHWYWRCWDLPTLKPSGLCSEVIHYGRVWVD